MLSKKDNSWHLMQKKFDPDLWEGLQVDIERIRGDNLTGKENND